MFLRFNYMDVLSSAMTYLHKYVLVGAHRHDHQDRIEIKGPVKNYNLNKLRE